MGNIGGGSNPGVPDRFSSMTGSPNSANGGGTPVRHGALPPTVIISPSAPVSLTASKRET
jgi:serine/threonine-protein phosphatase 2A regulatory subunit B'